MFLLLLFSWCSCIATDKVYSDDYFKGMIKEEKEEMSKKNSLLATENKSKSFIKRPIDNISRSEEATDLKINNKNNNMPPEKRMKAET